ncbi:MAG TPA: hypothetical protein VKY92_14030, partial [Verrucomicrobiae bacterium]|nr:hypothetical protein [Verrucomicrobiae bacterium]
WRDGASGGRICYTNLHPDLLLSLGIPTNRIETARARAAQKAIADARYRAQPALKPAAPFHQSSETNRTDVAAPWLDTQYAASSPDQGPAYSSGPIYNGFPYMYPLDSAQSAPRAASAPGANPASSSIDVPRAPVTPSSGSTPSVPPARGMGHAVSGPSAPPASGPHRR